MQGVESMKIIINGVVLNDSQAGAVKMAVEMMRNLIIGDEDPQPQAVAKILGEVLDITEIGE